MTLKRPIFRPFNRSFSKSFDSSLGIVMARKILADVCVSISELKKNPSAVVAKGEGFPVAVLNRNEPDFYCIPAEAWEEIVDRLEDMELNAIADARQNQPVIEVDLNDL